MALIYNTVLKTVSDINFLTFSIRWLINDSFMFNMIETQKRFYHIAFGSRFLSICQGDDLPNARSRPAKYFVWQTLYFSFFFLRETKCISTVRIGECGGTPTVQAKGPLPR